MEYAPSPRVSTLHTRLHRFLQTVVLPQEAAINAALRLAANETRSAAAHRLLEPLREKARLAGLWNLFLPVSMRVSQGLSHWEYAPVAEAIGRIAWAAEIFNCAQPDAGNMQLLDSFASESLKDAWLDPLLRAETRSAWAAAEPDAPPHQPDALRTRCVADAGGWRIDGRKTWVQRLDDSRCASLLVLCRSHPDAPPHRQFSVLLVPRHAAGIHVGTQFHASEAATGSWTEVEFDGTRVGHDQVVGQPGQGLEMLLLRRRIVALHDALWCLGAAERALGLLVARLRSRPATEQAATGRHDWQERIARIRTAIETTRMLARRNAWMLDQDDDLPPGQMAMLQSLALPLAVEAVESAATAYGTAASDDSLPLAALTAQLRLMRQIAPPQNTLYAEIAQAEAPG